MFFFKDNKELIKKVRQDAIEFAGQRAKRLTEQKSKDMVENKKIALKEQMRLEEEERSRIEALKENERKKATQEIESFKKVHQKLDNQVKAIQNEDNVPQVKLSSLSSKNDFFCFL